MPFDGSGTKVQLHTDVADVEAFQIIEITYDTGGRSENVQEHIDILPLKGEEGIGGCADLGSFLKFAGISGRGGFAFIDGGMQDNGIDPIEEGPFVSVVPANVPEYLQHPVVEGFEGLVVVGEEAFA